MPFARFFSWKHSLFFFLATTQARVALFELFKHFPEADIQKRHLVERQQQCTVDFYLSVLSAQPSGSDFCYTFDPNNYDTTYSTLFATATVTQDSASITYTNTRHATLTITATATSTSTDTSYILAHKRAAITQGAVLQNRQAEASAIANAIIERQLGSSASSVYADASMLSSVSSALSSGCECLLLPDPTINVTSNVATQTTYQYQYAVVAVTQTDHTTTSTSTVVSTTTIRVPTSSISMQVQSSASTSDTTIVQPTQIVSPSTPALVPVTPEITCPDSNNGSESVIVANYRYDYFVMCDTQTSGTSLMSFNTLSTGNAADCAAACSEANHRLNDAPCRQWTYDANTTSCSMFNSGSSYVEYPSLITGILLRVAQGLNSTNTFGTTSSSASSVDTSAVLASIDSGVTHVNPPAFATSGASSSCWSSATTFSNGDYSFSWGCTSTSSWYEAYATTYVTEYETTSTIIKSISGGSQTITAGDNGGQAASGQGGGMVTSVVSSSISGNSAQASGGSGGGNGGNGGASPASSLAIVTATGSTKPSVVNSTTVASSAATGISVSLATGNIGNTNDGRGGGFNGGSTEIVTNGTTVTSIASGASSGEVVYSTGGAGGGFGSRSTQVVVHGSASVASSASGGDGSFGGGAGGNRVGSDSSGVSELRSTLVIGTAISSMTVGANSGASILSTGGFGGGNITSSAHTPSIYVTIVTIDTTTTVTVSEPAGGFTNATISTFINGTVVSSVFVSTSQGISVFTTGGSGGGHVPPGQFSNTNTPRIPYYGPPVPRSSTSSRFINGTVPSDTAPPSGIQSHSTGITFSVGTSVSLATSVPSGNVSTSSSTSGSIGPYSNDDRTGRFHSSSSTSVSLSSFTNTTAPSGTGPTGTGIAPPASGSFSLSKNYTRSSGTEPTGTGTGSMTMAPLSTNPGSSLPGEFSQPEDSRTGRPSTCACLSASSRPICPSVTTVRATVTKTKTIYKSFCTSSIIAPVPPTYGGYSPYGNLGGGGGNAQFFPGPVIGGTSAPASSISTTESAVPTRRGFLLR